MQLSLQLAQKVAAALAPERVSQPHCQQALAFRSRRVERSVWPEASERIEALANSAPHEQVQVVALQGQQQVVGSELLATQAQKGEPAAPKGFDFHPGQSCRQVSVEEAARH
ncbi:hypothetical protein [Roseibium sp.]|uniref:hypothetical protein n=1 Tax=Roseibium sp. TaxID=1936156 RepID=UPI003A97A1EB